MLNNLQTGISMLSKIRQFSDNLKATGKNPEMLLRELVNSGKVSHEQLQQAKTMAELFAKQNNITLGGK